MNCPICEQTMDAGSWSFSCPNSDCRFAIWSFELRSTFSNEEKVNGWTVIGKEFPGIIEKTAEELIEEVKRRIKLKAFE